MASLVEHDDLETKLRQERAYSEMLELNFEIEVEKRLKQATAAAELAGYQRGVADNGSGMTQEIAAAIEAELKRKIPAILDEAIPEDLRASLSRHIRPEIRHSFYVDANTMMDHQVTRVRIPETVIQLSSVSDGIRSRPRR